MGRCIIVDKVYAKTGVGGVTSSLPTCVKKCFNSLG